MDDVWMAKVLERLDEIADRLSPPDGSLSEMSIRAMEEESVHKNLPPDVWDRYGVQWSCKDIADNGDLIWEALVPDERVSGHERIARMFSDDLTAQRGPLTLKYLDPADPLYKYKRPHAPRDTCGPLCNHEGFTPKDADPRQPSEDIASLAEGWDTEGIWAEPWEPEQWDDDEQEPLFALALTAVHDASRVNFGETPESLTRGNERLRWIAAGLVRQIEKRYQLFDQPAQRPTRRDQEVVGLANASGTSGGPQRRDRAEAAEVRDLRRALGELRTDFIRIHAIAGQHAAYEGNHTPEETS